MVYLDDWALLEREHSSSLAGAIEALEACTLRLPVTGGARVFICFDKVDRWTYILCYELLLTSLKFCILQVDSNTLKEAVCSALDVMQAMGSSVCSLQSRVRLHIIYFSPNFNLILLNLFEDLFIPLFSGY